MKIVLITFFFISGFYAGFAQVNNVLDKISFDKVIEPRIRVIVDNDFGGDPDGLFALAHHLMSPSVDIRAIIGSIQYDGGFYGFPGNAAHSAKMARELVSQMGLDKEYLVLQGSNTRLPDTSTAAVSEGAKAIVKEAMMDDKRPLFIVCGAGLTNIASAWLLEPKIAERIILVWIGGTEYDGLATPPPGSGMHWEYNTGIDTKAAQVIFNQSGIPMWQVPRNAYRQALVSYAELLHKVKPCGKVGSYLVGRLDDLFTRANRGLGEAYALGDSPLVLLTALQSSWEVDPSSSKYVLRHAPRVNDKGIFESNSGGRQIRVYDWLDTRLMFEDFYAKLALFSSSIQ